MSMKSIYRPVSLVILVGLVVATLSVLPVKEYLAMTLDWIQGIGPLGVVVLALLYIPASLAFVPGSLLTLGAGLLFGVVWGTVAVSAGSVLGATAAFLAGRTLARNAIEKRVARNPRFAAIDRAVSDEGFKVVLLTRLSPIFPFNLLNYAYGLTRVSLRDYMLASWIGMLPGTVLYVYLGSAVKNVAELLDGSAMRGGTGQTLLFTLGLIATVAVTVIVTRVARRALDRAVEQSAATTPTHTLTQEAKIQGATS